MLHIHNGDSSAGTARQSTIPGEHFAFREALIAGPTPSDLKGAAWRKLRATHLSAEYDIDEQQCEQELLRQEETLSGFAAHDEVVLWFEHDLFCQVHLVYLLDWFAARDLGKTKLSLICIGEFPGIENFRGLGELNADQLASLFDSRHEVTAAEFSTATAAWLAYCSPEPTALESFLQSDTSSLSFLKPALLCHLARYPAITNGLGRIEHRGLALINEGVEKFTDLFARFGEAEPGFGLGDSQFFMALKGLQEARSPLVTMKSGPTNGKLNGNTVGKSAYAVTPTGEAVLQCEADFVKLNGIDQWLGGVHLTDNNVWRWDEHKQEIVRE